MDKKESRHSWKGRAQIKHSVSSGLTLCAIEPQSETPKEGLIESSCFSIGWGPSNVEGEGVEEGRSPPQRPPLRRSEEHTTELQSHSEIVCRLLIEKKKILVNRLPLA